MRRLFFGVRTVIIIGFILIFGYLYKNHYISLTLYTALCISVIVLSSILQIFFITRRKEKQLQVIKENTHLLRSDPDKYLRIIDEVKRDSDNYIKGYLLIHKAKVLEQLNRKEEMLSLLENEDVYYLSNFLKRKYIVTYIEALELNNNFEKAKSVFLENEQELSKSKEHDILQSYKKFENKYK